MTVWMLIGEYAFIVASYAWVWVLATAFLRCIPACPPARLEARDLEIVAVLAVTWTLCWVCVWLASSC